MPSTPRRRSRRERMHETNRWPSSSAAWRSILRLIAAGLTLVVLSGCATSLPTSASKPQRQLPPAPAFVKRVTVKAPKTGDDLELVAARERAGRAKANDINACFL